MAANKKTPKTLVAEATTEQIDNLLVDIANDADVKPTVEVAVVEKSAKTQKPVEISKPMLAYTQTQAMGAPLKDGAVVTFNTSISLSPVCGAKVGTWVKDSKFNDEFTDRAPGAPCVARLAGGKQINAVYVNSRPTTHNSLANQVWIQDEAGNVINVLYSNVMPSQSLLPAGKYFGECVYSFKREDLISVYGENYTQNQVDNLALAMFQGAADKDTKYTPIAFKAIFSPLINLGAVTLNAHRERNDAQMIDLLFAHPDCTVYWGFNSDNPIAYKFESWAPSGLALLARNAEGVLCELTLLDRFVQVDGILPLHVRAHTGAGMDQNKVKFIRKNKLSLIEKLTLAKYDIPTEAFSCTSTGLTEGYSMKTMKEVRLENLRTPVEKMLGVKVDDGKVCFPHILLNVCKLAKQA